MHHCCTKQNWIHVYYRVPLKIMYSMSHGIGMRLYASKLVHGYYQLNLFYCDYCWSNLSSFSLLSVVAYSACNV